MPVRVRNTQAEFTPAPEGLHRAVCCDIVELGLQDTPWGKKRKIEIRWQIDEMMENGKPFLVTKRYGASLHPKANLRIDLESWRGRPFTDKEAEDFDLEVLLGVNAQLNIIHNKTEAATWANVKAIVPGSKGVAPLEVSDYIRVCKREGYEPPTEPSDDPPDEGAYTPQGENYTEDDIPF
jgi:hypothetical protein